MLKWLMNTLQFSVQIKRLAKSHGSKCQCCFCRGTKKDKQTASAPLLGHPPKLKPCICGSKICEKDWKVIEQEHRNWELRRALDLKKCICGSPICAAESQKMPEVLLEEAKLVDFKKQTEKQAIKKEKQYQKERKKRAKERVKARKIQEKLRKKQDKLEMKAIMKSPEGDVRMIAESLIDLGTFGSKAFCDISKFISRAVTRPRDVYLEFRDAMSDPGETLKSLKRSIEDVGLYATGKRLKTRLSRMPTAKSTVKQLESYQTTNYLLHMADKDPKKRMRHFKRKHIREPLDFGCSPYMASMRKRPCLQVYYKCPWFYPHCMSLLQLWKQFQDIILFILAVAVWSPCILFMEICRGFVCCLMCQG